MRVPVLALPFYAVFLAGIRGSERFRRGRKNRKTAVRRSLPSVRSVSVEARPRQLAALPLPHLREFGCSVLRN